MAAPSGSTAAMAAAINVLLLAVADAAIGRKAVTAVVAQPATMMMCTLCMMVLCLVAVAVAILAWIHYREGGDRAALFRASAFLVLAVQNIVFIAIAVAGRSPDFGLAIQDPGQMPVWSVILGRGIAAALLVMAGMVALRPNAYRRAWPAAVLWAPSAVMAVASVAMLAASDSLPPLLDERAIAQLTDDPTAPLLDAGGPVLILLQAAIGLAFLGAALISYRVHRRDGSGAELYDLAADANETKNLAAHKPDVAKRLTEKALTWRKSLP